MHPKGKSKGERAILIYRGQDGVYRLRIRYRLAPHLTALRKELGLCTHDGTEAWYRARAILRAFADIGILAGWSGEKFLATDLIGEEEPCSPRTTPKRTQKKPCHRTQCGVKQQSFPFLDAD